MNILVTLPVEEATAAELQATAPGAAFRFRSTTPPKPGAQVIGGRVFSQPVNQTEISAEDLAWAEVILGNVSPDLLQHAPNLKWLQTNSAGVAEFTVPGVLPQGAALTNASGAYGHAIGEHLLACLLSLMKKLHTYRDAQKTGEWHSQGAVRTLVDANVLILGMGDIGGEFGKRCHALGAHVIGIRRSQRPAPDYAEAVYPLSQLDDLLPTADVVAITLPGTAETNGMFNANRFSLMKQGSYLLNVGRGTIVDTDALCRALQSGHLAGAALDVTDPEPLPPQHPLWHEPNAIITPHISGFFHLEETYRRIVAIFIENLQRFSAGQPLCNPVDFSTGYRKTQEGN